MIAKLSRFKLGESITFWDGRTRLSVAGVQDKLNILQLGDDIGFGEGQLCSNKIFKFETAKVPFIVINELFTMLLARHSGIDIPDIELRDYQGVRTFVVDRFDRRVQIDSDTGQTSVQRRHIIDGCQATNLPPSYKYERQHGDVGEGAMFRDGVSFVKLMAVKTINHQAYQLKLIQWLTFNLINCNYDAHGKNISFFVTKQGLKLTPFYDLINMEALLQSAVRENSGRELGINRCFAMSIGDHEQGARGHFEGPITAYMLADFANYFGLSLARMQLIMTRMIEAIIGAVDESKAQVKEYALSANEIEHVELCASIVMRSASDLKEQLVLLPQMKDLF